MGAIMGNRLFNQFKFFLERLVLRGALYQLLIIAVLICLVSLLAGLLAFMLTPAFKWFGESAWWAFLRMSDPGYLGDDKGLILQTVSTIVTVLGYVLFMGALIAIMTQWLHGTMKKLESGLTPITENDHVLILGWTNRTPTIVRELVVSEGRVKRFLRRIGARKLHIVILAEEVSTDLAINLREELGARWNQRQITFRSGTPLSIEHLRRVDFMNAGVIILPGADFASEGSEIFDTRTIKSLLTISNCGLQQGGQDLPLVVAEMFDARKIPIAKNAYKGDVEIVAGDSVISRLIAQNVRHQGLSYIYTELLTHSESNEIYIREPPQLDGKKIQEIGEAFPNAVLLGVLRKKGQTYEPILNPKDGFTLENGDRLVLMARKYQHTEPLESYEMTPMSRDRPQTMPEEHRKRRLLIMGWNLKMPTLMQEFESYENESFEIDLLSLIPIAQREDYLSRYDLKQRQVKLRHLEGDYTAPSDLRKIHPEGYDNIIILSNSWMSSSEESDARTILGYLLLRDMLLKEESRPEILLELMDPENEKLFQQRTGEVLISPMILSHILAHVGLRRELNMVFEEIFTVGGAEIYFRKANFYGLTGRELSFREVSRIVMEKGDIALGVRSSQKEEEIPGGIHLNPPKDSRWRLEDADEVVVLTTYL
jgi:hypothetical protein